ncbi:MAG: UDP-N-acetylmuramate dehydrogenase [Synergistaceae bacterium]|jgi:UDP-N-acetylmuramate dehydrogenase|nr:UDP-N-acetylmuramate dehydrogenase [Synergistaceae bacterium]
MSKARPPGSVRPFVLHSRPLAPLTTWGVGGVAETLLAPRSRDELIDAVRWAQSEGEGFFTLGGGSNVLIGDGPINVPVLLTAGVSDIELRVEGASAFIDCSAGAKLSNVLGIAIKEGWSGLEFAAGIPGTVGGAITGNAGALTGSAASSVVKVRTLEEDGETVERDSADMGWSYRRCGLIEGSGRVVTGASFKLSVSTGERVRAGVKEAIEARRLQPVGCRTAGCVFKNPQGQSAGMLLDKAGCKGLVQGDARVSSVHANFIENAGGCSARDIVRLAAMCRKMVFDMFGVTLDFEIKTLGVEEEMIYAGL